MKPLLLYGFNEARDALFVDAKVVIEKNNVSRAVRFMQMLEFIRNQSGIPIAIFFVSGNPVAAKDTLIGASSRTDDECYVIAL
jgi:hypothetical protein